MFEEVVYDQYDNQTDDVVMIRVRGGYINVPPRTQHRMIESCFEFGDTPSLPPVIFKHFNLTFRVRRQAVDEYTAKDHRFVPQPYALLLPTRVSGSLSR
jgi:hypothetical protein